MTEDTKFEPDWVSPPGDSIREILELFDKDEDDLAKDMGRDQFEVYEVLLGRAPMGEWFIEQLIKSIDFFAREAGMENGRGAVDPQFWRTREQQFREGVERLDKQAEYAPTIPCPGPVEIVEYALVCKTCGEDDWTPDDDLPFKARHHKAETACCWSPTTGACLIKAHDGRGCKKPLSEG